MRSVAEFGIGNVDGFNCEYVVFQI